MSSLKVAMISSTMRDLPEHREQVRLACTRAGFAPREMMEHLTARNTSATEVSLRMVEEADIYIGILAYRYGYVPDGSDVSLTEMEYNLAVKLNKPRLIFFIHENHPVRAKDFEHGQGAVKLQALKERIGKERVAAFFESAKDLRGHVVEALIKLREPPSVDGAGDTVLRAHAALHRKTSIPPLPESYIAHPYLLLQSRSFVGRQVETNVLTDWVADPKSKAFDSRVFGLIAIGGMGKSALAWHWFNQIAPYEMTPLAGRLWWSFYESDSDFETFLGRALCYVSGGAEEEARALPWLEREARLLRFLNEKPYLLVLDGLERILIAYNRMDASHLGDHEYDGKTANFVAGTAGQPPSSEHSCFGQHRLRDCADPRAGAFLQKLTQVAKSRILITTRLFPRALQLPTGDPRSGCLAYFLRGMSDEDALGFWRAFGVSGSRDELIPIFQSVEAHPLILQALASAIANYRRAPKNFRKWRLDHPKFNPTNLPLVRSRTHLLAFALEGLSPKLVKILHTLTSFRMPASYDSLEALLVGSGKACVSVEEFDHALSELEDRGLIGWDREANRYDAHPIVRGVVRQLANPTALRASLMAVAAHFEHMPVPGPKEVLSLADLSPAIERYCALVALDQYDEAAELFISKLGETSFSVLAAHRERVMWLEQLFPAGVANNPALTREKTQISILHHLETSLQNSGRPSHAVNLLLRIPRIADKIPNNTRYRYGHLYDLSEALRLSGALRESEFYARQALALDRRWEHRHGEVLSLSVLGRALGAVGNYNSQLIALKRSNQIISSLGRHSWDGIIAGELSGCSLNLGDLHAARTWADYACELNGVSHPKSAFSLIYEPLLQGGVALASGDFARAEERLHFALVRARGVNFMALELSSLIGLAQLRLRRGDALNARASLDEVWGAIENGPYVLGEADAYNLLSEIELQEGNRQAALDAAIKGYRAAWCDGPPYVYSGGFQKAKAHLATLGAREPYMPTFDESKFEPLPIVEINLQDDCWVNLGASG